jgi:hypothetical protein
MCSSNINNVRFLSFKFHSVNLQLGNSRPNVISSSIDLYYCISTEKVTVKTPFYLQAFTIIQSISSLTMKRCGLLLLQLMIFESEMVNLVGIAQHCVKGALRSLSA